MQQGGPSLDHSPSRSRETLVLSSLHMGVASASTIAAQPWRAFTPVHGCISCLRPKGKFLAGVVLAGGRCRAGSKPAVHYGAGLVQYGTDRGYPRCGLCYSSGFAVLFDFLAGNPKRAAPADIAVDLRKWACLAREPGSPAVASVSKGL